MSTRTLVATIALAAVTLGAAGAAFAGDKDLVLRLEPLLLELEREEDLLIISHQVRNCCRCLGSVPTSPARVSLSLSLSGPI